jgi:hypothetical protein
LRGVNTGSGFKVQRFRVQGSGFRVQNDGPGLVVRRESGL